MSKVPRGCSAIDVVAAIRAKFLTCRREADFVVVCDVRKEMPHRLKELNDAQVSNSHCVLTNYKHCQLSNILICAELAGLRSSSLTLNDKFSMMFSHRRKK